MPGEGLSELSTSDNGGGGIELGSDTSGEGSLNRSFEGEEFKRTLFS